MFTKVARTGINGLAVLGLLLGGSLAGPGSAMAATAGPESSPSAITATGKLKWRSCPDELAPTRQCATLKVPYDYRKPRLGHFRLAVARIPATGNKTGSLFLNPGGPGGSGTQALSSLATEMSPTILASYDIVSWDPRGVGATKPALSHCEMPFPARPASGPVDWVAVRAASAKALARANRICQRRNSKFINHLGTNNIVRDLDALRAAVGDRKLTYWGLSYGTRIGYVYALRYPNRVRAMVLDGNIDPKGDYAGLTQGGVAPDSALAFIRTVSPATHDSVIATIAELDAAPIDLGGGLAYTRWNYLDLMSYVVAAQYMWPRISDFNSIVAAGRGGGEQALEDLRALMIPENSNAGGAFSVVNCLDYPDRMTPSQQDASIAANAGVAPVFAGSLTTDFAIGCGGLELRPDPVPTTRSRANRARIKELGIVISNATDDASTPLLWANRMDRSFPAAAFVKYQGGQHVLWRLTPSACVNDPIDAYMLTLQPAQDVTCPFAPPAGWP